MSAAVSRTHLVRSVVSVWVFLLLGLFLAEINVISDNRLLNWLPVGLIASALGVPVVLVYQRRRHRDKTLSPVRAFIVAGVLGALLGIVQLIVTTLLDVGAFREPLLVIVSSLLSIGLLGAGALLFEQAAAEQVEQRRQALNELLVLERAREDVVDITARMHTVLAHNIDAALSPARISIEERLRDQEQQFGAEEWNDTASQLRAAASETVAPLSRRLWVMVAPDGGRIKVAQILRNVVTKQALQPRLMAMIALASLTPVFVSIAGWAVGFAAMGWSLVFLFVTLGLGNAAMRRWPRQHAAIFITATIIVQAGHLLANIPARAIAGADPYTLPEFLVASVIGIFLVLLTSSFGTFRSYRKNVARTMTAELNTELSDSIAASRQVAQLARESARILHGTVQTRLIACAVAIERAMDTRDVEAFQAALHEAHAVLADPIRIENNDDVTVAGEVQRKTSLWSGLCDVTVDVDPQLANTTGRVARDIGRVVEEGLSNAIRHGGAGAISVSVEEANNQIVVVVEDDGAGPQGGAPGLGSSLLDSVSAHWQLTARGTGARLTVHVE